MTASILLSGCGQQTESQEESVQSSQVVQEVDESTGQNSMFQGTIFDNLVMGETTVTDVEELLDGKFLEYEYEDINKEDYEDDDGRQLIDILLASGEINHSETGENSQFQSDRKSQYTSFSFL